MTEANNPEWLSKLLDQLQAKDFYDAVQEVEKLGASDDFTKAVSTIGDYSTFKLKLGNHIMTREQAELAITSKINETVADKIEEFIKSMSHYAVDYRYEREPFYTVPDSDLKEVLAELRKRKDEVLK